MSKPLVFLPGVSEDISQARDWYAERSAEVSGRFLETLQSVLESIEDHPLQGGFYDERQRYRSRRLSKFPYVVVYREHPERTIIVAVYHTSRRPDGWEQRLDG